MTEKTIDPIFAPSVLEHAMAMFDDVNFDALKAEPRLEGVVDKNPKTAAIILAGGSGERFGHEGGKQLVEIAGKPILTRSAEVFDAVGDVGLIVIVCPEERMSEYLSKAIDPFPFVTPIVMAPAGSIRQESAFSGLELVPEEYEFVMLHDGARPLITKELIEHTISTLKGNIDCDGALVGHPSIDTLKVVENGVVVGTPDRSVFWNAQTPQVFRAGIYRRAHASAPYASALSDGFVGTDDSSLIERLGGRVLMVEGKRDNIKLTVPEDYLIISAAIRAAIEDRREEQL
ncbi:2-C-methyl-D-erythritol 4-phosphate cytidylyltransferase [Eggerthella sp. CAG:209]|nr:2-C-methyl-D-erythritol 4-phosphate cytidylyltransferase [Eggerthella sp. CAG:209]